MQILGLRGKSLPFLASGKRPSGGGSVLSWMHGDFLYKNLITYDHSDFKTMNSIANMDDKKIHSKEK